MRSVKDVNFLPEYVWAKRERAKKRAIISLYVLLGITVLFFFLLFPKLVSKHYEKELTQKTSELAQLSDVQKKVNTLQEVIIEKNKKKKILRQANKEQVKVVDLIDDVKWAIPYNTVLDSYSVSKENVMLSFKVHSSPEIIALMRSLENLELFKEVTIGTVPILYSNDGNTKTISFNLELIGSEKNEE